MLPVSAAWKSAQLRQFRHPAYLRVRLNLDPVGLATTQTVSSPETYQYSDVNNFRKTFPDNVKPYASLEPNRWLLDKSFDVIEPGQSTDDWWSANFGSVSTPTLTFDFIKPFNIPGIFFKWDTINGTHPLRVVINQYNNAGALVKTLDIQNITSVEGFYEDAATDDVKKVTIQIIGWSVPNWRVRIAQVIFGIHEIFTSKDRVTSATSRDQSDTLNVKLPAHFFNVTLRNIDIKFDPNKEKGYSKYLENKQLVSYEWGFTTTPGNIEWTPRLSYYLKAFEVPGDAKDVSLETSNRLDFIGNDFIYGTYTGQQRDLFSLATYILENSELVLDSFDQKPWVLSESLKSIYTTAPIALASAPVLLQQIAVLAGLALRIDPINGYVSITEFSPEIAQSVTKRQTLGDPGISSTNTVRKITANIYSYSVESELSDVGKSEFTVTGNMELQVRYSSMATQVSASVTGAVLNNAQYYANYAVLNVTANGSQVVTVLLKGKKITSTSTSIVTHNRTDITQGEELFVDTPMLTSVADATRLTQHILKRYEITKDLVAPYTGFPEITSGDLIHFETIYGTVDAPIFANEVKYNGGWSGTLETAKGVRDR